MKILVKAAIAAALVASTAQIASADLTYQGAVGLPLNPTAQIPAVNGIRVQGTYADAGDLNIGAVGKVGDFKYYGITAAGRIWKSMEINGGISKLSAKESALLAPGTLNPIDKAGLNIGAKYLITRETDPAGVRFAVGAGYDRAMLKNMYVYGVATKAFGSVSEGMPSITGHLGLRYDRYDISNLLPAVADSKKVSVYGGVEVPVTRTGDFTLVGELQSKNQEWAKNTGAAFPDKMPYSVSVRYRPAGKGISGSIGLQRQGLTGDNGLFLQLGYTFDTAQLN